MNLVYRALAGSTRRRILTLLRERDLASSGIAAQFELSWPTISGHLAVLNEADLVHVDGHGTSLSYHCNVSLLQEALVSLLDAFQIRRGEPR